MSSKKMHKIKAIIWNIRSVKSRKDLQRLHLLHKLYKFTCFALSEPLQHIGMINKYKTRIQMPLVFHNYSIKKLFFVNHVFKVNIISDTKQRISCQLSEISSGLCFMVTIVYAKCDGNLWLELWDDLLYFQWTARSLNNIG